MNLNYKVMLKDVLKHPSVVKYFFSKYLNIKKKNKSPEGLEENLYDKLTPKFFSAFKRIFEKSYAKSKEIENPNFKEIELDSKGTIFVFWYQGFDNLPEICDICLKSLKKQNSDKKIIYLDKTNYLNYVNISKNIIDKLDKGKISITHFSDILRFNILAKYKKTIWCDATLFFIKSIPDSYFDLDYINISKQQDFDKNEYNIYPNFDYGNVYFIGGENKSVFRFLSYFWEFYLESFGQVYDYFSSAMAIEYFKRNNPEFSKIVANRPLNNEKSESLLPLINEIASKEKASCFLSETTFFYKLNWHPKYIEKDNNALTFFGEIKKEYGKN